MQSCHQKRKANVKQRRQRTCLNMRKATKSDNVTTLNTPLKLPFNAHTYLRKKRNQERAPPVFHLNAASVAKAAASELFQCRDGWQKLYVT
jgi:hypothetical protein